MKMDKLKLKKLLSFIKWASLVAAILFFILWFEGFGWDEQRMEGDCLRRHPSYGTLSCPDDTTMSVILFGKLALDALGIFVLSAVLRWLIKEEKTTEK